MSHPNFLLSVPKVAIIAVVCSITTSAYAQLTGQLKFAVKNAADEKPLVGAKVTLKDSVGSHPDIVLITAADGTVTTTPLENHTFKIIVTATDFQPDSRDVTVVAEKITDVEVLLEPAKETVIKITGNRDLIKKGETSSGNSVSGDLINKRIPITAGNPQSLSKALRVNPGFTEDSANQSHPRGEHSQTSIYINGFLLPGALQGRAGQILSPESIQTFDVQTGGYAPEFGSETAAVLNLTLRAGSVKPFADLRMQAGSFSTFDGSLILGGQGGAAYGNPNGNGIRQKRFDYLVDLGQRTTSNSIEPPQPNRQSAHNGGNSSVAFGNFDYRISDTDQINLILNTTPAQTEIANRTGLPDKYKGIGQGYGYGGARDASDGLLSQQDAGQDIYQKDNNTFGVLQYRKKFDPSTSAVFSFGYTENKLDVLNHNPNVNLANLSADSSIEFNPTVKRKFDQGQVQAAFTISHGVHIFKFGGVYIDQQGRESYNLIPASQLALNALYATDPRFASTGSVQTDESGKAVLDKNGNPVFRLNNGTTAFPTVNVKRDGYYGAAYLQDTWRVTRKFTANYGLRFDLYNQTQTVDGAKSKINKTELSPRVNLAYTLQPQTVARASYNHLFTQPPLAQGAILGKPALPQTSDQYEGSVEHQFGRNQTLKVATYQKNIKNQLDTGLLIVNTQIGLFSTDNLEHDTVKGTEVSYSISPSRGVGLGGFLSYANATAKPRGLKNGTDPITDSYNDHDQLNTLTIGADYSLKNGASVGGSYYFGSGVYSSALPTNLAKRSSRSEVNLRLSTGTNLIARKQGINAEFIVENLFDTRARINFASAFSGTRFQQGRRLLFQLSGHF